MASLSVVDEFVAKMLSHFEGCALPDIHTGASENPFRMLHVDHEDVLKKGHWFCRRSPSRYVAEAVLARLRDLGMTVEDSDGGWGFVYAFRHSPGKEAERTTHE